MKTIAAACIAALLTIALGFQSDRDGTLGQIGSFVPTLAAIVGIALLVKPDWRQVGLGILVGVVVGYAALFVIISIFLGFFIGP